VDTRLEELKRRLQEASDLAAAASVLSWDQSTYMPPGGAAARGRQLALLSRLAHERFTDPEIGRLLEALRPYEESLPFESEDASLIRVTRRHYEKYTRVPPEFMAQMRRHGSAAYQTWTRARPANDFTAVRPFLEQGLELSRQMADFFPGYQHVADPLIDLSDHGTTAAEIRDLFGKLRTELVPMVKAIAAQPPADDSCLRRGCAEEAQIAFAADVIRRFGYDYERGRHDRTHHPFCTRFSIGDVRVTYRAREDDLGDGLFSMLHEAGHALYEQGVDPRFEATPLARGASSGVHESQSRLWENLVGRSRSFWEAFYPRLQALFPEQLRDTSLDTFYRAINKAQPSLIRTDADEVTYNLHVMIRFDLELELLEGRLSVADLPEAWRSRYQADLGVAPPDDRDGVLQDVHWFSGTIGGGFQGYTLGNIMSAQFFDAACRARPQIPDEIGRGEFCALHGWLKEQIYRHGRTFTPAELIERVTGSPLSIEPYVRYLKRKYGELYAL
jgi:carboxypeptidase Taq